MKTCSYLYNVALVREGRLTMSRDHVVILVLIPVRVLLSLIKLYLLKSIIVQFWNRNSCHMIRCTYGAITFDVRYHVFTRYHTRYGSIPYTICITIENLHVTMRYGVYPTDILSKLNLIFRHSQCLIWIRYRLDIVIIQFM